MRARIYLDPYSGYEILCLEHGGRLVGASYDPREVGVPVPWDSDCPHCELGAHGRQMDLPIHVRRACRMLATRRTRKLPMGGVVEEYDVPTLDDNHTIRTSSGPGSDVTISYLDCGETIGVALRRDDVVTWCPRPQGPKIAVKLMRLFLSEREATSGDVLACAGPLAAHQENRRSRSGRRSPCEKIVWKEVANACGSPAG